MTAENETTQAALTVAGTDALQASTALSDQEAAVRFTMFEGIVRGIGMRLAAQPSAHMENGTKIWVEFKREITPDVKFTKKIEWDPNTALDEWAATTEATLKREIIRALASAGR